MIKNSQMLVMKNPALLRDSIFSLVDFTGWIVFLEHSEVEFFYRVWIFGFSCHRRCIWQHRQDIGFWFSGFSSTCV